MEKRLSIFIVIVLLLLAIGFVVSRRQEEKPTTTKQTTGKKFEAQTKGKEILEETDSMQHSKNSNWWLNSGAVAKFQDDLITTNQGRLEENNRWRELYAESSPEDTDDGYLPQNLFRLVSKSKWQNVTQQASFKIDKVNLSDSDNRNESNGVLFFNRYQDGDNLYYTGLRVDGFAVIKKKYKGTYYTLKDKKIFSPSVEYDRDDNPNLLPTGQWVGMKSEIKNNSQGNVEILFYVDKELDGKWELVLSATDSKSFGDNARITAPGYCGIRTDFMDVSIKGYAVAEQ